MINELVKPSDTLPAAPEIEMSLIGCAMLAPKLWSEINFVRADDFTDSLAAKFWDLISAAYDRGEIPHPHKIADASAQTQTERAEMRDYLIRWTTSVVSPICGRDYARIVRDYADRRALIFSADRLASDARELTGEHTAADIAGKTISDLTATVCQRRETISAFQVGMEIAANLSKPMIFSQSRFNRFDSALGGGFYQNKFYGIGARMKAGKSLLLATLAYNMTVLGSSRVLYLCLEMGYEETFQRLLARKLGYNAEIFLDPIKRLDPDFQKQVRDAAKSFKDCGLYFQSRPRVDIDDLKSIIAREGLSGHVDGIIIDYLQLVTGKKKTQSLADHYDHVAQTMAESVKRYPIWILTAAQLNQEGNIRGGEGLLNACDMTFSLHKIEHAADADGRRRCDEAWLEMMASRYTAYCNIGSERSAGYQIITNCGPMFAENS